VVGFDFDNAVVFTSKILPQIRNISILTTTSNYLISISCNFAILCHDKPLSFSMKYSIRLKQCLQSSQYSSH
jgi:hypothetical protein